MNVGKYIRERQEWSKAAGSAKIDAEQEWKAFQEGVFISVKEVCDVWKMGGGGQRKGWLGTHPLTTTYTLKYVKRKVRKEKKSTVGGEISRNFRETKN